MIEAVGAIRAEAGRSEKIPAIAPTDPALRRLKHLKADQVAELLCVDVSSVWRWVQRVDDPLPCIRFGGRCTRFPLIEVEKWIARQQRRA